jgi:hypothetical protein
MTIGESTASGTAGVMVDASLWINAQLTVWPLHSVLASMHLPLKDAAYSESKTAPQSPAQATKEYGSSALGLDPLLDRLLHMVTGLATPTHACRHHTTATTMSTSCRTAQLTARSPLPTAVAQAIALATQYTEEPTTMTPPSPTARLSALKEMLMAKHAKVSSSRNTTTATRFAASTQVEWTQDTESDMDTRLVPFASALEHTSTF